MLPAEVMQVVCDHEHRQSRLYHWRALRFLTYHPGLSQLMQALAGESRDRLDALAESLMERIVQPCVEPSACRVKGLGAAHFFIVDDEMARLELGRTLLEESRSTRFYARLLRSSAMPDLDALLRDCVAQCRAHCRLLEETRQSLPSRHRSLGSIAPSRRRRRRFG